MNFKRKWGKMSLEKAGDLSVTRNFLNLSTMCRQRQICKQTQ